MGAQIRIALDAMGGDHGPPVVVSGAALSLLRHPDTEFLFFGDQDRIALELARHEGLSRRARIVHTDVAVAMDDKPSQALRQGRRRSSMWLALEAVKSGEAQAAVSAGNTGALMAMAKFCLRTLPGIERPAIAAIWPTIDAECIVLDVGANVGADARQLLDFAGMGAALARTLFHREKPLIGLLNIGVEEIKGLEEIKRAGAALKRGDLPIAYHGFVEGDDVGQGVVDVVVTDGFTGNIALKTAEGTAKQIGAYLRAAMNRSLSARLGAFLAQGALRALKAKMDPRRLNGGMFLGLNGVVIKSHGGADDFSFASAIDLARSIAGGNLVESITKDVQRFQNALQNGESQVAEVTQ